MEPVWNGISPSALPINPFGLPMVGRPWIPEDQIVALRDLDGQVKIYYHSHISRRGRYRRPHGRRNGPRRYKPRDVLYRPAFDTLKKAPNRQGGLDVAPPGSSSKMWTAE